MACPGSGSPAGPTAILPVPDRERRNRDAREDAVSNGKRRGSSVFAGLLLVLIGVLFLIAIYDPKIRLGHLIAVYWPALLILWGVAKIFDSLLAQRQGQPRPAAVSGGEAALVVALVIALCGFVIRDWVRERVPQWNFDMPEFGPSYSRSENLPPDDSARITTGDRYSAREYRCGSACRK